MTVINANSYITTNGNNDLLINNGLIEIFLLDKTTLKLVPQSCEYKRGSAIISTIKNIKTRSGRSAYVESNHSVLMIKNGILLDCPVEQVNIGDQIAVPRFMPIETKEVNIDYYTPLKSESDIYIVNVKNEVKLAIEKLKINGITQQKLSEILNTKIKTLSEWKNNNAIAIFHFDKLAKLSNIEVNKSTLMYKAKTCSRSIVYGETSHMEELFRLLAYIIADGHMRKLYFEFTNEEKELREDFIYCIKKCYNYDTSTVQYDRAPIVRVFSGYLTKVFNKVFNIPYGKKSRLVKIPDYLWLQNNTIVSGFIRALYDCEANVQGTEICFSTTSHELVTGLSQLLLRYGIISYYRTKIGHVPVYCESYILYISGENNLRAFQSNIGFLSPKKHNHLIEIIEREVKTQSSNMDTIPNIGGELKNFRVDIGLTKNTMADKLGISRRMVGRMECQQRRPSIHTMKKYHDFIQAKQLCTSNSDLIKLLGDNQILWDEIIEIKVQEINCNYIEMMNIQHQYICTGFNPILVLT